MLYMLNYKNTFRKAPKDHLSRRVVALLRKGPLFAQKDAVQDR